MVIGLICREENDGVIDDEINRRVRFSILDIIGDD
jgi:hypothetical protein